MQIQQLDIGALGPKVERWRRLVEGDESWTEGVRSSLLLPDDASDDAVRHDESQLRALWERLQAETLDAALGDSN